MKVMRSVAPPNDMDVADAAGHIIWIILVCLGPITKASVHHIQKKLRPDNVVVFSNHKTYTCSVKQIVQMIRFREDSKMVERYSEVGLSTMINIPEAIPNFLVAAVEDPRPRALMLHMAQSEIAKDARYIYVVSEHVCLSSLFLKLEDVKLTFDMNDVTALGDSGNNGRRCLERGRLQPAEHGSHAPSRWHHSCRSMHRFTTFIRGDVWVDDIFFLLTCYTRTMRFPFLFCSSFFRSANLWMNAKTVAQTHFHSWVLPRTASAASLRCGSCSEQLRDVKCWEGLDDEGFEGEHVTPQSLAVRWSDVVCQRPSAKQVFVGVCGDSPRRNAPVGVDSVVQTDTEGQQSEGSQAMTDAGGTKHKTR